MASTETTRDAPQSTHDVAEATVARDGKPEESGAGSSAAPPADSTARDTLADERGPRQVQPEGR